MRHPPVAETTTMMRKKDFGNQGGAGSTTTSRSGMIFARRVRRARSAGPCHGTPRRPSPAVEATVKWFNPEGFGFAELADGSGDAFLHIAALQAAGYDTVQPGAKVRANIGQGAKGPQITRVLEIDESAAAPPPRGRPRVGRPGTRSVDRGRDGRHGEVVQLRQGFGFVACDDGGKDVFLHVSVLQRSGVTQLAEGQRVSMGVVDTPRAGRRSPYRSAADRTQSRIQRGTLLRQSRLKVTRAMSSRDGLDWRRAVKIRRY